MPIQSIERLTKDSSNAQIKAAISDCIATEVNQGREQDQAIAMCHSMAREKVGEAKVPKKGED